MIRLILEAVRQWVLEIISSLTAYHYDTMPTDEEIIAMPNNTHFFTKGFYSVGDGAGGEYIKKYDSSEVTAGLQLTDRSAASSWKSHYIVAVDNGTVGGDYINACRYGIRPSDVNIYSLGSNETGATLANTYAAENTAIFERLKKGKNYRWTLEFPAGKFYFKDPLKGSNQFSIKGYRIPSIHAKVITEGDTIKNYKGGTALIFPFLKNGAKAVSLSQGTIEDVTIIGSYNIYHNNIDRTKTLTAPSEIYTEVIGVDSDNNSAKCVGLFIDGYCNVRNVCISNFYYGCFSKTGNVYMTNISTWDCHTGVSVGNDTKLLGVYGWKVHTLLEMRGSISSAVQVRADSCYNLVHVITGGAVNLIDLDGDYCVGSVIKIGATQEFLDECRLMTGTYGEHFLSYKDSNNVWHNNVATVNGLVVTGAHGRAMAGKAVAALADAQAIDVNSLADSTDYGVIDVGAIGGLTTSIISINGVGASNVMDSGEAYSPNVALSFRTGANVKYNQITVGRLGGVTPSVNALKKIFQLSASNSNRIETFNDTYYIEGINVTGVMVSANS